MPGMVGSLALIVATVLVIWTGNEYFERSAARLSKHYGLPVAVHGAIVVAVGGIDVAGSRRGTVDVTGGGVRVACSFSVPFGRSCHKT